MEVSLHDILNAREARVRRQQALLIEYRALLFCFTMNIAGSVKTTPLIERGFCVGLEMLDSRLPQENILFREIRMLPTGCEANYAISIPASKLKLLYIGLPHFSAVPCGWFLRKRCRCIYPAAPNCQCSRHKPIQKRGESRRSVGSKSRKRAFVCNKVPFNPAD